MNFTMRDYDVRLHAWIEFVDNGFIAHIEDKPVVPHRSDTNLFKCFFENELDAINAIENFILARVKSFFMEERMKEQTK